jgi:hypothetical protein
MANATRFRRLATLGAVGAGVGLATYGVWTAAAWLRYGRADRGNAAWTDADLDRFMPQYDIVERHQIQVGAPAAVTFAAACELDIQRSAIVRAIFKGRELILGSDADRVERPREFLALTKSLGWGVLAETPGREVIMGAVTQPWKANVVFRAVSPDAFAAFDEPDHVKIAWTLRAEPIDACTSVFRTETRAIATDASARAKFRTYWSLVSPGVALIRLATLRPVRDEAERRADLAACSPASPFATDPFPGEPTRSTPTTI